MNADRDVTRIVRSWLEEGATALPDRVLDDVLGQLATTPQRRHRPAWRLNPMTTFMRFAATAAIIAVFAVMMGLPPKTGGPGGQGLAPGDTPAPLDTSTWTTYTSDRYGFSIGHPADWSEHVADHTWTLANDSDWLSPAQEWFRAPDQSIRVSAWSVEVPAGSTADAWIQGYCQLIENDSPCTDLEPLTDPVTMDGHAGTLVRFVGDTQAFIPVDDRMYVVAAWRPESDPSAAPYGGATRLLEGYLSTMHLLPGGPALDTSGWTTYTSDRYGFSIGHPADWTEQPSDHIWTMADAPVLPYSPAGEHFRAPDWSVGVSAWSVPVDPGTNADAWIRSYCQLSESDSPCADLEPLTDPVTMDGHAGSLVKFIGDTQAFFPVDDRMYVVAVWRPDADPTTASYGGSARLLEGYLSTMRLLPGGPAAPPSTAPSPVAAGLAVAPAGVGAAVGAQSASPAPSPSPERPGVGQDTAFVEHLQGGTDWLLDESERYGYIVGYPPGRTVRPAERAWTFEADATDRSSPATEDVIAPDGEVRVSVWSVPLETVPEAWGWVPSEAFVPWIESYCEATGNTPCTGILERAVPLCLERRDCHPGLLVPFDDAVQAFFSAGLYEPDKMVIMSVWGQASDPALARYGGREALLEAFLSTMAVWPRSVPLDDRVVREVPRSS